MKLVQWVRFTWDLDKLPPLATALPDHYHFAGATDAEQKELHAVIARSFALDTSWGDAMQEVNRIIDRSLTEAFTRKSGICLTLRHGLRIIGAAVAFADPLVENHLSPGPCVLMEYRNRGLGTALLGEALRKLRDAGLAQVGALAKSNAPAARFLYPKFNGILVPDDTPLLAA